MNDVQMMYKLKILTSPVRSLSRCIMLIYIPHGIRIPLNTKYSFDLAVFWSHIQFHPNQGCHKVELNWSSTVSPLNFVDLKYTESGDSSSSLMFSLTPHWIHKISMNSVNPHFHGNEKDIIHKKFWFEYY